MTTKKAIWIMERQLARLKDNSFYKDDHWTQQTATFIKDFFGEDSNEYYVISQVNFIIKYDPNAYTEYEAGEMLKERKANVIKFMENAIDTLKLKGVVNERPNFLYKLNDTWLTCLISLIVGVIMPGVFSAGYWYGSHSVSTPATNEIAPYKPNADTERISNNNGRNDRNHNKK